MVFLGRRPSVKTLLFEQPCFIPFGPNTASAFLPLSVFILPMYRKFTYAPFSVAVNRRFSSTLSYVLQKRLAHGSAKFQAQIDDIDAEVGDLTDKMILPHEPLIHPISSVYLRTHAKTPMVLLLGNHSSGKSTFINSLLGVTVQETGVAPTDDGFTAIIRGDASITEDGQTAVSNPKYGFSELRSFGDAFLSNFRVKTRKLPDSDSTLPYDIMLIDSPGMIDTPQQGKSNSVKNSHALSNERGYDFKEVVRWLGRRCDLILLLFDPSNPGTTGETLDILTHSLVGLEHKFIILFNKIDVFQRMNDFARCYGTLCWNLAKVLCHKDLPRIYITYTKSFESSKQSQAAHIESSRSEIIKDIYSAPIRRIDNLLSELDESCRKLYILCFSINHLKKQDRICKFIQALYTLCSVIIIGTLCILPVYLFGSEPRHLAAAFLFGILGSAIGVYGSILVRNRFKPSISTIEFEIIRQGVYQRITDWKSVWGKIKPMLNEELKPGLSNLSSVPRTKKSALQSLSRIIEYKVPELRRSAHTLKFPTEPRS